MAVVVKMSYLICANGRIERELEFPLTAIAAVPTDPPKKHFDLAASVSQYFDGQVPI